MCAWLWISSMNAAARARHNTVAVLTTVGIVNGGLVGGIGPSIDAFAANTGLSQSTLAGLVLQMKLSKLLGNYCWTYYANSSARHGRLSPRGLHAALMLCSAGLSCVVARARTSPRWLQLACWGFGLCYGCSDAGVLMVCSPSLSLRTAPLSPSPPRCSSLVPYRCHCFVLYLPRWRYGRAETGVPSGPTSQVCASGTPSALY